MKLDYVDQLFIFSSIVMVFVFIIIFLLSSSIIGTYEAFYETKNVDIINVDPIVENGEIEYLEITFADGDTYKTTLNDDIDLTVNSKLIIEFGNAWTRGFWWDEWDEPDDIWYISKIIKVPDEGNDSGIIEVN